MKHTASIELTKKITPKVYLMRLKMASGELLDYQPGQFINLGVGENIRRSYSIASNPSDKSIIDLYNDVEPGGPGSQFFINAKVGQEVNFLGPLGMFTYKGDSDLPAYFISTGTGFAPIYCMLLQALEVEKTTREITLIQGFRYKEDIFLEEELKELDNKYPNFKYFLSVTRPDGNWTGITGRVTEVIEKEYKGGQIHAYVCGSQKVISAVEEQLVQKGVEHENIFYEKFY